MEYFETMEFLKEVIEKSLLVQIDLLSIQTSETVNGRKHLEIRYKRKPELESEINEGDGEQTLHLIIESLNDGDNVSEQTHLISEGKFLTELIPDMKKVLPKSFKEIDELFPTVFHFEAVKYLLIMENLKNQGYRSKELNDPHTHDEAKNVLGSLAKFHAYSFVYIDQIGGAQVLLSKYPFLNEKRHILDQDSEIIADRWELFQIIVKILSKFPEFKGSWNALVKYENNIEETCRYLVAPLTGKFPDVINHGDLWNPNILFNLESRNVKFIDFHAARICSPAIDLSYYFMISTGKTVKESLNELLEHYYNELKCNVELSQAQFKYSLEEFMTDYKLKSKYGLFYGLPTCLGSDLLDCIFQNYETGNPQPEVVINNWFQDQPDKLRIIANELADYITLFEKHGEI